MARSRYDETWHRLREWTKGQTQSERLAAQILVHEGFQDLDPSHPLGGKDGGKDAVANKDGMRFVMAVYFPRGQSGLQNIEAKFRADLGGVLRSGAKGIAFVTNQELTLAEREILKSLAAPVSVELFHLERITTILDTPAMAKTREQFLDIEANSSPSIQLGGQGGAAPGSGGGGGGAMGPNATGGPGGPGGDINLHGAPGKALGAGGGGAGAIGEGAIGGEGGGGGEHVILVLGPDEIGPASGVHHFDIQIGKGGVGGPGEDTILNLCDEGGNVLRSIVAKGGKMGKPPYVPLPSRLPTEDEIKAGLRVTGMFLAGFIRRGRDGLWTIVDGGWDWIQVETNPFRVSLPVLIEVNTGTVEPTTVLDLKLAVCNPKGFQVLEQRQPVLVEDSLVRRSRIAVVLEFSGSQSGLWQVHIFAGPEIIGTLPIEIRATANE